MDTSVPTWRPNINVNRTHNNNSYSDSKPYTQGKYMFQMVDEYVKNIGFPNNDCVRYEVYSWSISLGSVKKIVSELEVDRIPTNKIRRTLSILQVIFSYYDVCLYFCTGLY